MAKYIILLVAISYVSAQFPWPELDEVKTTTTARPGAQPWFLKNYTSTKPIVAVPEDTVIVDLRLNKELLLKCPKKSKEDFVIWYKVLQKKKQDKELTIEDPKYYFPNLLDVTIKELSDSDEGVYYCKDYEPDSPARKRFRVVIIDPELEVTEETPLIEIPVWVRIPDRTVTVSSTGWARLPCRAQGTNVKVTAYRLKDDGTIFKLLRNKGVAINRPKLEDSGKYKCIAENSAGKIEHEFEMLVQVHGGYSEWSEWGPCDAQCGYGRKSRIKECNNPAPANGGRWCSSREQNSQRVTCRERTCTRPRLTKFGYEITDKSLILHCHAKGIPTPNVEWRIGGSIPSRLYDYQNPTMVIPLTRARRGSYSCKVRNTAGYFTMYITIHDLS